jgi:hypothetical protein
LPRDLRLAAAVRQREHAQQADVRSLAPHVASVRGRTTAVQALSNQGALLRDVSKQRLREPVGIRERDQVPARDFVDALPSRSFAT